ncbi:MAG TPA: DUF1801 domain-containing protein [Thermoplasmata archaeon]|nr:DUF1801 domain-containing protein [Thermoplasmata archaeon]
MKPYKGKDVEGYLTSLGKDKLPIVQDLRKLIREAIPDSRETIKWGTLIFEKEKIIGAIMVHKERVNLQLWRGSELTDKNRMLEGSGRSMRHLRFLKTSDIKKGPVKALLKEAGSLK